MLKRVLSICLIGCLLFTLSSGKVLKENAYAFTETNADEAMEAFNNVYWDPVKKYFYCNSDRIIHSEHAHGPENGLYTDFWWEAQLWNLVMDAYERTGGSNYLQQIHDVYDGFIACYPNFISDFNDDIGWWALASARAYELTGDEKYKTTCKVLFDRMYEHWDTTYGGGIWWKNNSHDQKNVATNGAASIIASKIYGMYSDSTYLDKAQEIYSWVKTYLSDGEGYLYDHIDGPDPGNVVKWDFTYNFGVYLGAAHELYKITGDITYKNDAYKAADWVKTYLTNSGILINEGADDGGGFKLVFVRYLYELIKDDLTDNQEYIKFLQDNATSAWNHRRASDNLIGTDWSANTSDNYIQSLTAASAVSIMNLIPNDGYVGIIEGDGVYEAENSQKHNISTESRNDPNGHDGHTGRGYLAGWNGNDTYVDFMVNVKEAKKYNIVFHYSAGAGDASRKITLNNQTYAANQSFDSTGNWDTWQSAILYNVDLLAGSNVMRVEYNSYDGNSNWLNLDSLSITEGSEAPGKKPYNIIEAEDFDEQQGVIVEDCSEGTKNIGGIVANDYTAYYQYDFGQTSATSFEVRGASDTNGGQVEVRLDSINGPLIGTATISNTNGWQNYVTSTCTVSEVKGIHDIYLVYKGDSYLFNINWFKFVLL